MISVCAPYWQRQDALDGMVEMYGRLYPDLDLEIVIADDGSPEPAEVPADSVHPVEVVYLPQKDHALNPCTPMNCAVQWSWCDIIVLTNPETRHEGPVLHELMDLLEHENDYVTARCYGIGYPGAERVPLAGPEVDYTTRGRLPVPEGAHFHFLAALHRTLWCEAGGFDDDYRHVLGCDDNDWLWRLDAAGARFKCAEGTVWQERSTTRWGLPHGLHVFREKWPEVMGAPA